MNQLALLRSRILSCETDDSMVENVWFLALTVAVRDLDKY